MAVMTADLCYLFFVTLDAPKGADIISIDETFLLLLCFGKGNARGKSSENELSRDIHLLMIMLNTIILNKIPNRKIRQNC
jgi:hypothetical protein